MPTMNANPVYFGYKGLDRQPGGTFEVDRFGVSSATENYKCRTDLVGSIMPKVDMRHPIWPSLLAVAPIRGTSDGPETTFQITFRGLAGNADNENAPIYELDDTATSSRISTHKLFKTQIGGTPTAPLHGAVFKPARKQDEVYDMGEDRVIATYPDRYYSKDVSGKTKEQKAESKLTEDQANKRRRNWVFDYFPVVLEDGTENEFGGVEDYLNPQLTWTKSYTSKNGLASVSDMTTIQSPPGGPPALPAGANWLYVGANQSRDGGAFKIKQTWRASGIRGWNDTIY